MEEGGRDGLPRRRRRLRGTPAKLVGDDGDKVTSEATDDTMTTADGADGKVKWTKSAPEMLSSLPPSASCREDLSAFFELLGTSQAKPTVRGSPTLKIGNSWGGRKKTWNGGRREAALAP